MTPEQHTKILGALAFIRDIAEEEYPRAATAARVSRYMGAEVALRHILRRAKEALEGIDI
jgi:hypothetical protein